MRVLLLGASGFVGRNLKEFFQGKHELVLHNGRAQSDLRDMDVALELVRSSQPEAVINCAAHVGSLNYVSEKCADVLSDNCRLLTSIFEAVRLGAPEAILVNPLANCAYPAEAVVYRESELWDGPLHTSVESYGCSRRVMWMLCKNYLAQYRLKSICLVTPNMYGPYDSLDPNKAHALDALVSKVVKAQIDDVRRLEVWGTGKPVREWLFVRDFARVVEIALEGYSGTRFGSPVNIGQEDGLTVRELVEAICTQSAYSGEIFYDTSKQDGAPVKVMSSERFRETFPGFTFTPIREGILETIDYYRRAFALSQAV